MGFPRRGELQELNDKTRRQIGGTFIQLSDGYTHYELGGPADGKGVALVHGFSVPYFIWDPTFNALTSSGFRVLRYDLFGRGFSDRPRTKYNLDLFIRQLHELLDKLGIQQVFVIGLSMGGAISSGFAVKYPERVLKLALIDPIGTQPMPLSWIYKAAILPGVSELILELAGTEKMVKAVASDFFDPAHVEMFQKQYRPQMQYRGFKRAILSTLRNKTVNGFPEIYNQLGKLTMPVLLFWGRRDQTVPFEQSKSILAAVPRTEFHAIEDTGHIPHYEKPEIVNPILIQFLNK
ncbi:MAG: alpha/beta hydrolase [Chloroflexi bacterium]|nr:alpha/beta hydrolase [Chloroflexota bacterium]